MPEIYITPPAEIQEIPCVSPDCSENITPNMAIWYNVGISHYSKAKGVSYIQVHDFPFACSETCAKAYAHSRADLHTSLPFGVFDAGTLNPAGGHADSLVEQNALYTPLGRGWATLPKVDALTGKALGDDIYVPHVDRWVSGATTEGIQGGYHQITGELGTSTLEEVIQLIHIIIDQILTPQYQGEMEVANAVQS